MENKSTITYTNTTSSNTLPNTSSPQKSSPHISPVLTSFNSSNLKNAFYKKINKLISSTPVFNFEINTSQISETTYYASLPKTKFLSPKLFDFVEIENGSNTVKESSTPFASPIIGQVIKIGQHFSNSLHNEQDLRHQDLLLSFSQNLIPENVNSSGHLKSKYLGNSIYIKRPELLLGQSINCLGNPFLKQNSSKLAASNNNHSSQKYHNQLRVTSGQLYQGEENFKQRLGVTRPFFTGIRAIDYLNTLGEGSRVVVYAEPGVGKSSLLSQINSSADADIKIIALIGERGREAVEFIEEDSKNAANLQTIYVIATSDEPAIARVNAAYFSLFLSEYFASQGKRVLYQLDSLTRLLRAWRDLGLVCGEFPVKKGYPASVFERLPKFFERFGCFNFYDSATKSERLGSITAIFTMLISEGYDDDPMVEEVKSLLDGHLYLSRKIAETGHFPALDILKSISRVFSQVNPQETQEGNKKIRQILSVLDSERELSQISGYQSPRLLYALAKEQAVLNFLRQSKFELAENNSMQTLQNSAAWLNKKPTWHEMLNLLV